MAGLPHCSFVRDDLAVQRKQVILLPPVTRYCSLLLFKALALYLFKSGFAVISAFFNY
jgi:hypothetical protein